MATAETCCLRCGARVAVDPTKLGAKLGAYTVAALEHHRARLVIERNFGMYMLFDAGAR